MSEYIYEIKDLGDMKIGVIKHHRDDPALANLVKFTYVGRDTVYHASKEFVDSRDGEVECITE